MDPYTVPYKGIYAVCNKDDTIAEIIEQSSCYGGSAWSRLHYSKSPLVLRSRSVGDMFRYTVRTGSANFELKPSYSPAGIESVTVKRDEVEITYAGLGGGGVGATTCRANAGGVLRCSISDSGGGKMARGTIVVPRRERVIIGVDDTDSKEVGATWSMMHNVASAVDSEAAKYISHALVQLYPVKARTQNCVSTVVEFACVRGAKKDLVEKVRGLVLKYSVSKNTGMAVLSDFEADYLLDYSRMVRTGEVSKELALETALRHGVEVVLEGNGIIGAVAALPWFGKSDESPVAQAQSTNRVNNI